MKRVFIDSDVLIDFLTNRRPHNSSAKKLISRCYQTNIEGVISTLALANIAYVLRKEYSMQEVRVSLSKLMDLLEVVDFKSSHLRSGIASSFIDFEDSLQHEMALSARCNFIITRNVKDYKQSLIPIMSAEQFLATQPT